MTMSTLEILFVFRYVLLLKGLDTSAHYFSSSYPPLPPPRSSGCQTSFTWVPIIFSPRTNYHLFVLSICASFLPLSLSLSLFVFLSFFSSNCQTLYLFNFSLPLFLSLFSSLLIILSFFILFIFLSLNLSLFNYFYLSFSMYF